METKTLRQVTYGELAALLEVLRGIRAVATGRSYVGAEFDVIDGVSFRLGMIAGLAHQCLQRFDLEDVDTAAAEDVRA